MKFSHIFLLSTTFSLIYTSGAFGASVSFSPTGSQLDNDLIPDLSTNIGESLNFSFFLDTTGLNANLTSLELLFAQDSTELETLSVSRTDADIAAFPNFGGVPAPGTIPSAIFSRSGPGIAPNTLVEIVVATYLVQSELINDGLPDQSVTVISATDANGTDVTALFEPVSQSLDVQPVPESSFPLSLLTFGAIGFTFIKHKKSSQ
ncbi:hypothetical protein [Crocosphaera sp. Alani8]|uniref:hypothetical protein n=1 Tax=Crocosphaera sp. Alani8 TaxID=3038952 RepID=UPI00313DA675